MRPKWIDERLAAGDAWENVARSAACHLQTAALDLMPWQLGPLYYADDLDAVLREPFGDPSGKREAGEVIKKAPTLPLRRACARPRARGYRKSKTVAGRQG
jgi:hypothetical protein